MQNATPSNILFKVVDSSWLFDIVALTWLLRREYRAYDWRLE
jgi:hypothetical protein